MNHFPELNEALSGLNEPFPDNFPLLSAIFRYTFCYLFCIDISAIFPAMFCVTFSAISALFRYLFRYISAICPLLSAISATLSAIYFVLIFEMILVFCAPYFEFPRFSFFRALFLFPTLYFHIRVRCIRNHALAVFISALDFYSEVPSDSGA